MATRRNTQSSASKRRTSSKRSTRRNAGAGPRAQQQVPGQLNQYQDYGGAAQIAPLMALMKQRIGQQSQLQPMGGGQGQVPQGNAYGYWRNQQNDWRGGAEPPVRQPPGGFPGPQGVGPQPNPQNPNGNPVAPLGANWGWRNLNEAQRQRIRNRGGHWGGPEGGRPNPNQIQVPPGYQPGPGTGFPGGPPINPNNPSPWEQGGGGPRRVRGA